MLEFRSAADTIVTGVTFQNAPYWALHPYNCSRFSVEGVRPKSNPGHKANPNPKPNLTLNLMLTST